MNKKTYSPTSVRSTFGIQDERDTSSYKIDSVNEVVFLGFELQKKFEFKDSADVTADLRDYHNDIANKGDGSRYVNRLIGKVREVALTQSIAEPDVIYSSGSAKFVDFAQNSKLIVTVTSNSVPTINKGEKFAVVKEVVAA